MEREESLFTVTVDPQGRVTLPRALRQLEKIEPGKIVTLRFVKCVK